REALRLDDAEGVDCLPNEEIFVELARMGYEKPSTKLMFYKAFFSSQWKFLIHTILQCMSAKRTSWNEFSSSMASAVICLSSEQEIDEEGDADEHVKEVNTSDAAEGDDSVAHKEVSTVAGEQSIPSPTPPTLPPQPPQDLPLISQVQHTPPQSPQAQPQTQPQPQQADDFPMSLLQEALDACDALTRRVEHLEIDMDHASKVLSMQEDEPAEVQEVVDVVTTSKLITEVVTAASETVTAASTIIYAAEPQVPAATITGALARVATAPSKRKKGV
nr:hypothetical protein [Tanacetum cinerariifolium]